MEARLADIAYRRELIQEIRGNENIERAEISLRDTQIYGGQIKPYVEEELRRMYSDSASQYPIVSSINVAKKVTDSKASLYREEPTRDFSNLDDAQTGAVELVYKDMMIDQKMMASNKLYELQRQTHVYLVPKMGKLKLRALANHQLNVVPREDDPEVGEIYVFASFNKQNSELRTDESDGYNQKIGDLNDYDGSLDRFVVWSPSYHFIMNGNGEILSEETENPIAPHIPIIEIVGEKDFEYWTRNSSELASFTVDYNTSLSSEAHIVNMQGHAQAFLKAPEDLMPTNVMVGPSYLLKLITNPQIEGDVEFGFASPNADLNGVQSFNTSLLSQFLSTQGMDANAISTSNTSTQKFASGTERLLALIEKFEASKDTMGIYTNAEKKLYEVVTAWLNVLSDSDLLDVKYKTREITDSELSIVYNRPEGTISELEKLDILERKRDLDVVTKLDIIMQLENKTREEAEERLKEIEQAGIDYGTENGQDDNEEKDITDDRPAE